MTGALGNRRCLFDYARGCFLLPPFATHYERLSVFFSMVCRRFFFWIHTQFTIGTEGGLSHAAFLYISVVGPSREETF
jgi:hypothetical protein